MSSVPARGAPPFPDRPMVGRPVVSRSIQVRILVGEPISPRSSSGKDTPALSRQTEVRVSRRGTNSAHGAQWTKRLVADQGGAVSSPAVCSNLQRVGEPGRPCLVWNQEIGGSNPPTLTNCPRSTADESGRLLNGGSGVQFTPRAPTSDGWPSGKATRC